MATVSKLEFTHIEYDGIFTDDFKSMTKTNIIEFKKDITIVYTPKNI